MGRGWGRGMDSHVGRSEACGVGGRTGTYVMLADRNDALCSERGEGGLWAVCVWGGGRGLQYQDAVFVLEGREGRLEWSRLSSAAGAAACRRGGSCGTAYCLTTLLARGFYAAS